MSKTWSFNLLIVNKGNILPFANCSVVFKIDIRVVIDLKS